MQIMTGFGWSPTRKAHGGLENAGISMNFSSMNLI